MIDFTQVRKPRGDRLC